MNEFPEDRVLDFAPKDASEATPERVLTKICGTTSVGDAEMAARFGADFLGVIVEHAPSPRNVELESARAVFSATKLPTVAVTVNKTLDELLRVYEILRPAALQLHGDESAEIARKLASRGIKVWAACSGEREMARRRAIEMTDAGATAILLDARSSDENGVVYGGTGELGDWELAREMAQNGARVILTGGLTPENVCEAIAFVRPCMVDVASGVEARKGIKDAGKVRDFIRNAR